MLCREGFCLDFCLGYSVVHSSDFRPVLQTDARRDDLQKSSLATHPPKRRLLSHLERLFFLPKMTLASVLCSTQRNAVANRSPSSTNINYTRRQKGRQCSAVHITVRFQQQKKQEPTSQLDQQAWADKTRELRKRRRKKKKKVLKIVRRPHHLPSAPSSSDPPPPPSSSP